MKYEELIKELCDVIKESELNASKIYENIDFIRETISESDLSLHVKEKIDARVSDSFGMLQHQDLHRQKIERVVNTVCDYNNIDKSKYNIADSAKHLAGDENDDLVSEDDIEELIKKMQQA